MSRKDGPRDDGGISMSSPDSLAIVNRTRHETLELAYDQYLQGRILKVDPVVPPSLELLSHFDLTLKSSRDPQTNECPQNKCVVFKGETSLFDRFIDFAMALVKGKDAVGGFKAPSEIRFPPTGLKDGLSYEEFAARVEVVEYVMWVSDFGEEDEEETDESSLALAVMSQSIQSLSEIPTSVDDIEIPENEITANGKSQPARTLPNHASPTSGSSSSLSPPPEVITTPPSMKRYSIRKKARSESASNTSSPGRAAPKPTSPTPPSRNRRRRNGRK
ncbi:hypothetical protein BKA56DRAFT_613518 [Ilyonectria sp. MPI-CAGE-AT-0026]|nr:hypothetical protein BKA56DRAFT_613518 [Ilyonectria sp. MPI-CAGE-AT-0026]